MSRAGFGLAAASLAIAALLLAAGTVAVGGADYARASGSPSSSAKPRTAEKAPDARREPLAEAWRAAARFGSLHPAEPVRQAAPAVIAPPRMAEWLRLVGCFEDSSGNAWAFIKDERSARVLKLRLDGTAAADGRIAEAAQDSCVVVIDAASYTVRRK